MAEIEDKVILDLLREGKILDENIINDVYRIYQQLQKAGDSVKLLDVFVNRGYLTNEQSQQLFSQNNVRSPQKISDYEIVKKLGAGGMGSVFLVKKDGDSTLMALKVLPKSSSQNEKIVSRFNREFRALQQLKHPAIIGGIEKGFSNGYHFYSMEYFEGQNLKTYVQKNKPLDFKFAVETIRTIAVGLQYAVGKGIIHRDIKPDNIIITKDAGVKIIDFGLVKIEHEDSMGLTKTQTAMGTPHFISCEQAKNAKEADLRSDIYSLGATLFYMVTAEYPVKGTTAYEVLAALISGKVEKPNIVNPLIPEALNQLILNMMGLAVEDRYQDYEVLLKDIDAFLKGQKIKPIVKGLNKSSKWKLNKNYLYLTILIVLLGIIIHLYKKNKTNIEQPKIPVSELKLNPNELEDFNKEQTVDDPKEVFKYRIVNSFDREYKRKSSLEKMPKVDSKLETLLNWLSLNDVDEKASKDEKLIAKAYTLLAFCGAGYDFYQGSEVKKMENYLNYIIEAKVGPGKWSDDLWVNVICTNAIIESFAMHGSDNEELSNLSIEALSQLDNQLKEFNIKTMDKSILGSHMYILAIRLSKIAGVSKLNKLSRNQIRTLGSMLLKYAPLKRDQNAQLLDKLDLEAISQLFGKLDDKDEFLKKFEEDKYIPKNCREAYFFILFYGISSNKNDSKWLLDNAMTFLESKTIFKNEISHFGEKNGSIVTNAIGALAIENVYRIPREVIPKRKLESFRNLK